MGGDYPIRPQPPRRPSLTDAFWKPKILNAEVTIPFEVAKAQRRPRARRQRARGGDPVARRRIPIRRCRRRWTRASRALAQRAGRGNSGFEVAATWFTATGQRDLLDPAIKAADALYDDFKTKNPPFSGGERDAINCLQLYRVTHDKKHLDLAKHYLDIRGLENSVNRSRHNQSLQAGARADARRSATP